MLSSALFLSCLLLGVVSSVASLQCSDSYVLTPSSLSDSSHSVVTEDAQTARIAALCHVACINYLFRPTPNGNCSGMNNTGNSTCMRGNSTGMAGNTTGKAGNSTGNGGNSSTTGGNGSGTGSEPMMPGIFQLDCRSLRKYLDCRNGCVTQSSQCVTSCRGRCQGLCQFPDCTLGGIIGNRCGAGCDPSDCATGCQMSLKNDLAPKPTYPPTLMSRNNQSVFDVDYPMELGMNMYHNPTLLFQIEHSPGQFVYQWMVDIMIANLNDIVMADFILDLNSYPAGSVVNVSYSYVTAEAGLSPYSDPRTVNLSGLSCVPRRLTDFDVEVTIERDTRAGFFNHPVLNVSWCPGSCIEGVSNYTVTRRNCIPETVIVTANANETSVVLRSSSSGYLELPCSPQIMVEVQRNLHNGEIQTVRRTLFYSVNAEDFPNMDLSSTLNFNKTLSLYVLDYTIITRFSPATLSFINNFFVSVTSRTGNGDQPGQYGIGLYDESIRAMVNQRVYTTKIFLRPFTVPNNRYDVSVNVIWEDVRLPQLTNFINVRDAVAPAPLPVKGVNITNVMVNDVLKGTDTISFKASAMFCFEPAVLMYKVNVSVQYEVHFGINPADETTVAQPVAPEFNMSSNRLQGYTSQTTLDVSVDGDFTIVRAVLQFRAYQFSDFRGNWSEPVYVQVPVLAPPDRPRSLEISITSVQVDCGNDESGGRPFATLEGLVTWEDRNEDIPREATVSYVVKFNEQETIKNATNARLNGHRVSLSDLYYGTLSISVTTQVELLGETQSSRPSTLTIELRPLPHPQDITVSHKNPRLSTDGPNTMLSVDVVVEWNHPENRENIINYEIMFRTGNAACPFYGYSDRDTQPIHNNDTQFIKNRIKTVVQKEGDIEFFVQMRSIPSTSDILSLPQWSEPKTGVAMFILPPPTISSTRFLSFSLVQENNRATVDTEVEVIWQEPEGGEEPDYYEIWVGSRPLGDFEDLPTDNKGVVKTVNATSEMAVNSTSENSTATDNSTTTDNTTMLTTTTISGSFLASLPDTTVYVQIRSISQKSIPKWSTAEEIQRSPAPPPSNIVVGEPEIDIVAGGINIKVEMMWELPDTTQVPETPAPETPAVSSSSVAPMTPSTTLLLPSPSPSPSPEERVRRQASNESISNETDAMNNTVNNTMNDTMNDTMDDTMEDPAIMSLGEITAVYVYIGRTRLERFSPRPEENVQEFKPDDTSGTIDITFDVSEKDPLQLFVQMQIETEEGFPQWSEATVLNIPPQVTEPPKDGVSRDDSVEVLPIILSVVGVIILLLVIAIAVVIFFIYNNRRKYRHIKDTDDALEIYSGPGLTGLYRGKGPILDEWEISTDDVIVDELLGEGAFGEVYKGVIRGPLENPKISAVLRQAIGVPVAIKLLKTTSAGKEKADFLAEIDMMKKIAEGYNAHIVNMVGCVTLQEPLCLITEFVPFGDLLSYLKHQRKKRSEIRRLEKMRQQQTGDEEYEIMIRSNGDATVVAGEGGQGSHTYESTTTGGGGDGSTMTGGEGGYEAPKPPSPTPYMEPANAYSHLDPKQEDKETEPLLEDDRPYKELGDLESDDLIRFAYQIASGMEYLASLNIVHRDLACRNVLISNDKLLKITDFGLSREVQEVYVKKTKGRLPLKWMAIESITAREFTTASDVWAFGVALYEIGTIGGFPYPSINNEDLLRMLSQGYRLEKPENCSADVYALMLDCWQEDPHDRPSFSTLRSKFSAMLQAGSAETYIDLQVNEAAPYYQFKEEERRERSDSESSEDSEGSVDSITKEKKPKGEKKKLKRKKTNPYVPTPQQGHSEGNGVVTGGEDGYIAMESASVPAERPIQLGIPISQLMPGDNADETETPPENRKTNPYVSEPSELADNSLVASSVPLVISLEGGTLTGETRSSNPELAESTHL